MANARIKNAFTIQPINIQQVENDEKYQRRRSIIREFSLNTTAHGIPGIARSQSKHNCLFWSIATIIFIGIMLYFVIESIKAYFNYPTQTSVVFSVEWPQAFPAFSFCNLSPVRLDKFIGPFINYTNSQNLTNINDTSSMSSYLSQFIPAYFQFALNNNQSTREMMYPLSSMLIKCTYNGLSCTVEDFITFVSPTYGLCYTFNAKVKNGIIRYINDDGGTGKLELHLYIHSHQYIDYWIDHIGVVGQIHDNVQLPFIDVDGLFFGSGQKHKLCFSKRSYVNLPSPYSNCTDQVNFAMHVLYNNYDNADYGYSQLTCFTTCSQAYSYIKCGCVSVYQWSARSIVLPNTNTIIEAPICNITDICPMLANTELMSSADLLDYYCRDCRQACSSVDYPVKTSSSLAPPDWFMNEIKLFVENSSISLPNNWSTLWRTYIQRDYVAITIERESTLTEIYTQQASMSAVDVLSNIGGQTGLWIGISFLSLAEVAELIYRLIRYQYKLFIKARKRKTMK